MNRRSAWLVASLAGTGLLLSSAAAGASTGKAPAPTSPGRRSSPPAGYVVVNSAFITAPTYQQTHGSVTCPGTEQPSSGGALVESSSVWADLNSSYPTGSGWAVDVNNASGADTTFFVFAVCLNHSAGYTVVGSSSTTTNGMADLIVKCPAHTAVSGGGVISQSFNLGVNITSMDPLILGHGATGWRTGMADNAGTSSSFTVYAICRPQPKGYSIQRGPDVSNGAGSQTQATATCSGTAVTIGGGLYVAYFASDTLVTMNSFYPHGANGWAAYENNGGNSSRDLQAIAICAGT